MRELGPGAHSSARGQHACQPSSTGTPVILMPVTISCNELFRIRGSIVVSISACHAEDPGSIPGRSVGFELMTTNKVQVALWPRVYTRSDSAILSLLTYPCGFTASAIEPQLLAQPAKVDGRLLLPGET